MEKVGNLGDVALSLSDETFGFFDFQAVVVFDEAAFSVLGKELFDGAFAFSHCGGDIRHGKLAVDIGCENVQDLLNGIGYIHAVNVEASALVFAHCGGTAREPDQEYLQKILCHLAAAEGSIGDPF